MAQLSNIHHVVPDKNGGWVVKNSGLKTYGYFATEQEALNAAKTISQQEGTKIVVHDKNGEVRQDKAKKQGFRTKK